MHAEDLNALHRQAADTARLVQCLAAHVHGIGESTGEHRSEFENLIAALDGLAAQAWTAAESIDGCLALECRCADPDAAGAWAIARDKLAVKLIGMLGQILDAAVAVYRLVCSELADRLSIAEEHLPSTPATAEPRLTSTVLGKHTRVLAATRVARATCLRQAVRAPACPEDPSEPLTPSDIGDREDGL